MRYTTLIDITEQQAIYANHNARLLYLHMALKCGYHDNDRDILEISIRRLAIDCGLSVSATRHALAVLTKAGLLTKQGTAYKVLKWIAAPPPTPRTQAAAKKAAAANAGKIGDEIERERQDYQRRLMEAVRTCTRQQLEQWASELEEGRSLKHCGINLNANQDNVRWLRKVAKDKPE